MSITRREICLVLPTLLPIAVGLQASEIARCLRRPSRSIRRPCTLANNNEQIRLMLRGKLATGEGVEVHETTLPPGGAPTATTHHHPHSEMWLVREGTIELAMNGKAYRLEPGSVGFVRSNEEHGIRNVGASAAVYFVVAIGPGAEAQE